MPARHVPVGKPVHDREAQGIDALVRALPDRYVVFSNVELPTGARDGQTYEHDAVVIAPHAVFAVELKSWGGKVTGNRDRWTLEDGAIVRSPLPLILSKARVLKGFLQAHDRSLEAIWVQGLVFLTAPDAHPRISPDFESLVFTRQTLRATLTDRAWLGLNRLPGRGQLKHVERILADGKPVRAPDRLGDFDLVERLPADDAPYESWLARARLTDEQRILHVYAVTGPTRKDREHVRRLALREATLVGRLQGGADILRYQAYFTAPDPLERIVLQFEDTTPLQPLDTWVASRSPGLTARLQVAARVGRALAYVHDRGLIHRRLSPDAVLVSDEDDPAQVRLCAFDLARDVTGQAPTITGSSLGRSACRCIAPEVVRSAEATPASDLFSLGATLFELLCGRPLFATVDDVLRPYQVPPLHVDDRPVPGPAAEVVERLLSPDPAARPADAGQVADAIEGVLDDLRRARRTPALRPGAVIHEVYELQQRLGQGAIGTTWRARHRQTGQPRVLKIADSAHAATLQEEARVLEAVDHPSLVKFFDLAPTEVGHVLVLELVEGVTAELWAGAGDPLDPPRILRVARGLFGAIAALHAGGYLHRDVKPTNLMLSEPDAHPTLIDPGLARPVDAGEGDLAVGSVRYKDPLVYDEGRWTPANDQYAAFLVLYELLTGDHPFGTGVPDPAAQPRIELELLPDTLDRESSLALDDLFHRALDTSRAERPADIPAALAGIEAALVSAGPPGDLPFTGEIYPGDLELDLPVASLPLSARGRGALARLGTSTVAEVAHLDPQRARSLSNVGTKTVRELVALKDMVLGRWPDLERAAATARRPLERFFPPLADDARSLNALTYGSLLADAGYIMVGVLAVRLEEMGLRTIGDLARVPPDALEDLEGVEDADVVELRAGLRRLAGLDSGFGSLAELDAALRDEVGHEAAMAALLRGEVGEPTYDALESAFGLTGNQPVPTTDLPDRLRVSRLTDLRRLRQPGSCCRELVAHVEAVMPPAGISTLDAIADALVRRLPVSENDGLCAKGFARLGALLMREDGVASQAPEVQLVLREPWTEDGVHDLLAELAPLADWPPRPRREVEVRLWDLLDDGHQRALARCGADAAGLLDALLRLSDTVAVTDGGGLYTPPVPLEQALAWLRPGLPPLLDQADLLARAEDALTAVAWDGDPAPAIQAAGYRPVDGRWVDKDRIEGAAPVPAPVVDDAIPRERVADQPPPSVQALASAADLGGLRVVALPPASHHRLSCALAGWRADLLGPERVRYLDLDRLLIDALKREDYWDYVRDFEAQRDPDWSWARPELEDALDAALASGRPGQVTVLGRPSLLGTLDLMSWLGGFYDRARGGRFGLVVLALPGGIHDNRVRLNETHNLPYTPDMAAVYLEHEVDP